MDSTEISKLEGAITQSLTTSHQDRMLDWMDTVQQRASDADWSGLLLVEGMNVIDALLAPIHTALLQVARMDNGTTPSWGGKMLADIRHAAYQFRQATRDWSAKRQGSAPDREPVLFWPRAITHIAGQLPVATELRRRNIGYQFLASDASTVFRLGQRGERCVFAPGTWPQQVRAAHRDGLRRAKMLVQGGPMELAKLELEDKTLDLERVLRKILSQLFPHLMEARAIAIAALDHLQPQVLVVGNDLTLEGRVACLVAKARHVPTVTLAHGSTTGIVLHGRHCTDRFLAYGEQHARNLMALGTPSARIRVCGAPYLDRRPRQAGIPHAALTKAFGIRAGDAWVLIATSGPGHMISHRHHQIMIRAITELSATLTQVKFIVRLHRKDHPTFYRDALGKVAGAQLRIVPNRTAGFPTSIFDWLQGCPVMLTGGSTTATEAMLMGVPVISMDFCGELKNIDFIDAGASTHITSPESLRQAVESSLESPAADRGNNQTIQKFLGEMFYALDGRSAVRAADEITTLTR